MFKILFLFLTYLLSLAVLASEYTIYPADKAKLVRDIGESVYVACKKNDSLGIKCTFDCGNGVRFEAANGHCLFLRAGAYYINSYVKEEQGDIFHTASVVVKGRAQEKSISTGKNISNRASVSKQTPIKHSSTDSERHQKTYSRNITENLHYSEVLTYEENLNTNEVNNINVPNPAYSLISDKEFNRILNQTISKQKDTEESDKRKNLNKEDTLLQSFSNDGLSSTGGSFGFQGEAFRIDNEMNTIRFSNSVQNNQ